MDLLENFLSCLTVDKRLSLALTQCSLAMIWRSVSLGRLMDDKVTSEEKVVWRERKEEREQNLNGRECVDRKYTSVHCNLDRVRLVSFAPLLSIALYTGF